MPTAPTLMFQHALDYLKGWPNPSVVDFVAKKSANVTVANVYGGMVAHLNASGEFELGCVGTQMAIFLIQGDGDYDVANVSATGAHVWTAIAPRGNMSGLVAIGGYELETTEFDTTKTYAPGNILHSPVKAQVTGADKTGAGKLYKTKNWTGGADAALAAYTDNVCAVVSRAAHLNAHRVSVLSFWPVYLPGNSATT